MSMVSLNGINSSVIAQKFENVSRGVEKMFHDSKFLPHYQYFTRPIYKACVKHIGPVAATAVSFLSADLIFHQLLVQTGNCLASYVFPSEEATCDMAWSPWKTLAWMAIAALVMYAKFQRSHK